MIFDDLKKYAMLDRLTVEQKVAVDELLVQGALLFDDKEVYVEEPDDIDEEVKQVWTEAQLKKLREAAVVAIANDMGIDASTRDAKADTIAKILAFQAA